MRVVNTFRTWNGPPKFCSDLEAEWLTILDEVRGKSPGMANSPRAAEQKASFLQRVVKLHVLVGNKTKTIIKNKIQQLRIRPGFLPQGGGAPPQEVPPSEAFALPKKIWSENNRKISITINPDDKNSWKGGAKSFKCVLLSLCSRKPAYCI